MDHDSEIFPVVILDGSDMVVYSILRSLTCRGIPLRLFTWNKSIPLLFSRYKPDIVKVPSPILHEDEFIREMVGHGIQEFQRYGRRLLLIPTADHSFRVVANHYESLKRYFIAQGDLKDTNIELWTDKITFFTELEKTNVPFPRTIGWRGGDDIQSCIDLAPYPCVIKPAIKDLFYSFYYKHRRKAIVANTPNELKSILQPSRDEALIIQELVPGGTQSEASWCGYRSKDTPYIQGCIARMSKKPPFQTASCVDLIENQEVDTYAQDILNALSFWGVCEIEFIRDPVDGTYKVIEMNPRFCLYFYVTTIAGLNLPAILYNDVYFNRVPADQQPVRAGIRWIDAKESFNHTVLQANKKNCLKNIGFWAGDLRRSDVCMQYDWIDPGYSFVGSSQTIFNGVRQKGREVLRSIL
jgi:D-aspartate ligase